MKTLILLFSSLLITSCQSQQKNEMALNKDGINMNSPQYFVGTWRFVEKNYGLNSEKAYQLHECMKLYTWVFEFENEKFYLTKNFAGGKDCAQKSSSKRNIVRIDSNTLTYFSGDHKKIEKVNILSPNRFSITSRGIIDGSVQPIEDIYERQ